MTDILHRDWVGEAWKRALNNFSYIPKSSSLLLINSLKDILTKAQSKIDAGKYPTSEGEEEDELEEFKDALTRIIAYMEKKRVILKATPIVATAPVTTAPISTTSPADLLLGKKDALSLEIENRLEWLATTPSSVYKIASPETKFETSAAGKGHWGTGTRGTTWKDYLATIDKDDASTDETNYACVESGIIGAFTEFVILNYLGQTATDVDKKNKVEYYMTKYTTSTDKTYYGIYKTEIEEVGATVV